MKDYIKKITKDLEPGWIDKVIEIRDETIEHGKKHPNFKKVGKEASWASLEDCLMVYAMVRYHRPTVVLEIGTYIGTVTNTMVEAMTRSTGLDRYVLVTNTMGEAMINNNPDHPYEQIVYTCDKNNVYAPTNNGAYITYYNKLSSKVLKDLKRHDVKIDFCFIDGGLKNGDAKTLKKLYANNVVFATHDYKEDQKGVRNIKAMKKVTKKPTIYKPTKQSIGYDVGLDYNINSSVGVLIA